MKSWFRFPIFIGFILVFVPLFGFIVMLLWNALIPELFHGPELGYWQAVGLLVLSKILFGHGPGKGGGSHHRKNKMWWHLMQKWERMSPEEREKMRLQWKEWGENRRRHDEEQWERWGNWKKDRRRSFSVNVGWEEPKNPPSPEEKKD